jgi:hypothetical protein
MDYMTQMRAESLIREAVRRQDAAEAARREAASDADAAEEKRQTRQEKRQTRAIFSLTTAVENAFCD